MASMRRAKVVVLPPAALMPSVRQAMDVEADLRVRVNRRGKNYVWELYRNGKFSPVKFSVPIYASEQAAKNAGDAARMAHLAVLNKNRWPRR
jgi:hypothetical protein